MPALTVIIPTRNRPTDLLRAMESVRRQTFCDWECLVIDDGSTDETAQTVLRLAAEDPRIIYLRQERFGHPSRGRNLGISSARAPLIAFLDDDDSWYPEKLAKQVAVFDTQPEVGMVFARIRKYGLKDQIWPTERLPSRPGFAALIEGNFVPTSTVAVRLSVLEAVGLFNERYVAVEDYDLWLRIAQVSTMCSLPEVLCDYLVHPGSNSFLSLDDELHELELVYNDFEHEWGVSHALLTPGRRNMHLRRAVHAGGPRRALTHLWRALCA
jgi:O-antigen biosynthesis protein